MTTIINPWVFYWIEVLTKLCNFMEFLVVIGSVSILFLIIFACTCFYGMKENERFGEEDKDYKENKTYFLASKKIIKSFSYCLIVSILFTTFIPSKETMYTMLVAQNVTTENIEIATDIIKDSVDYIFDKFNESEE